MTQNEILERLVKELAELEELIAECEAEAEEIKDTIKQEMLDRNVEELTVGTRIIRWTTTLTNRFDTTKFKNALPDVYKSFTKQISSRRFSIS